MRFLFRLKTTLRTSIVSDSTRAGGVFPVSFLSHLILAVLRISRSCIMMICSVLTICTSASALAQADVASIKLVLGEVPNKTYSEGDWIGFNTSSTLDDGTELNRYVAEVSSEDPVTEGSDDSLTIRFTFVPRFNCTPLISIIRKIPERLTEEEKTLIENEFSELELFVDGTKIAYPGLVEQDSGYLRSFYNTNLQRRANFRILLEVGSTIFVSLGESQEIKFSLSGSKQTISTAMSRCKAHS